MLRTQRFWKLTLGLLDLVIRRNVEGKNCVRLIIRIHLQKRCFTTFFGIHIEQQCDIIDLRSIVEGFCRIGRDSAASIDSAARLCKLTTAFHKGPCFSASEMFIDQNHNFSQASASNSKHNGELFEQDLTQNIALRTNVLRSAGTDTNVESWSEKSKCGTRNNHPRKQLSCAPNEFYRKLEALNKCSA